MALLSSWVVAARPRTLPAAVAPVLVGAASASADGAFRWDILVVVLFAAVVLQVGVNFANDLADARSGADDAHRVGPTRAVASGLISPREMRLGVVAAFSSATVAGLYLVAHAGWVIAAVGAAAIVAALAYTAGPWPYGYHGFGEVFVFAFFGLAATAGSRYVFDRSAPLEVWVAGGAMGLLAAAILEVNNVRDLETDERAGKRTLAVVLGRRRARLLYAVTLTAAFAVIGAGAGSGALPSWSAVSLLAAPLAVPLIRTVLSESSPPALIGALVGTARLQLLVAVLIAGGVLAS